MVKHKKMPSLFLREQLKAMKNFFAPDPFDRIETLLLFIGYPRSGHTLIGSLLDAHSDTVIAHEMGILGAFFKGEPMNQIFSQVLQNSIEFTLNGRQWMGYNYAVPNQWQGQFRQISVIGDKSGGYSTRLLKKLDNAELINSIDNQIQKQIKLLHVIRNPFDNISTMVIRTNKRNDKPIDESLLKLKIKHYFDMVKTNQEVIDKQEIITIDVYLEDFIKNPIDQLGILCDFLDLKTNERYLKDCASIVWSEVNQSRCRLQHLWTPELVESVQNQLQQFDFLRRYLEDIPVS